MEYKAIETHYNGYRFRSRLEARWAVIFDALNIKYQYEPEGFEVDIGEKVIRYLPDFYLPDYDYWIEVKSCRTELLKEKEKLAWCIDYNSTPISASKGLIILGQIPNIDNYVPNFSCFYWYKGICSSIVELLIVNDRLSIIRNEFDECTSAPDMPGLVKNEDLYFESLSYMKWDEDGSWLLNETSKNKSLIILKTAFDKGRQARFEYGENG
jgi:hypothetical protein